jgi:hypothetical protein
MYTYHGYQIVAMRLYEQNIIESIYFTFEVFAVFNNLYSLWIIFHELVQTKLKGNVLIVTFFVKRHLLTILF